MSVLKYFTGSAWEPLVPDMAELGYSSVTNTPTLPGDPDMGEVYEYLGVGVAWTITANSGQYIRLLSDESVSGGTIAASSGYDCVTLVYVGDIGGHNTWLVKGSIGTLEVT